MEVSRAEPKSKDTITINEPPINNANRYNDVGETRCSSFGKVWKVWRAFAWSLARPRNTNDVNHIHPYDSTAADEARVQRTCAVMSDVTQHTSKQLRHAHRYYKDDGEDSIEFYGIL